MKQRIKRATALITLCICLLTSVASAATFTAYSLPIFKGNNYTNSHVKQKSDQYITNKVTAISGTSFANFWAVDDNKKSQSNKYKQNVSSTATRINFKSSANLTTGQNVMMAMENASWKTSYGFVSGEVDFR